jgi:hypothetical protein
MSLNLYSKRPILDATSSADSVGPAMMLFLWSLLAWYLLIVFLFPDGSVCRYDNEPEPVQLSSRLWATCF